MILAVDAGNSRIKWGLHDGRTWVAHGAAGHDAHAQIEAEWHALPQPHRVAVSNVAGARVREEIARLASLWNVAPRWIAPAREACGVLNTYEHPEQLGVDRWAALVAARALHAGDCLVVMIGTATTVNLLDAAGHFRGGIIIPGVALMKQSLHANTAALPLAAGRYREEPRNTADAIESGCLDAQAGAIERLHRRLAPGSPCFLAGGDAHVLASLLCMPVRREEHLVLDGVRLLADGP